MLDRLKMGDRVKAPLDTDKLSDLLARYTQYAIPTLSYRDCDNLYNG